MKRILIATDGSPSAREAIELGLELARDEQAEVTFVHVLPPTQWELVGLYAAPGVIPRLPNLAEEDPEAAKPLQEAVALAEEAGVPAKVELRAGSLAEEVVGAADTIDADLIVVGSRGLGGLRGAVLGSVSRGVVRRANRPVLVVRGAHVREEVPA
jgi:nucleotide-binding universal stress UspA family protein